MRNCKRSGQLLKFKNVHDFKSQRRPLWIELPLVLFKENGEFFPCFVCKHCNRMKAVSSLKIDQEKAEIEKLQCVHSKAADYFIGQKWEDIWELGDSIQHTDESYEVECNPDFESVILRNSGGMYLAVVKRKGKISILFTLGKRKIPFCSRCGDVSKGCPCHHLHKDTIRRQAVYSLQFIERNST